MKAGERIDRRNSNTATECCWVTGTARWAMLVDKQRWKSIGGDMVFFRSLLSCPKVEEVQLVSYITWNRFDHITHQPTFPTLRPESRSHDFKREKEIKTSRDPTRKRVFSELVLSNLKSNHTKKRDE